MPVGSGLRRCSAVVEAGGLDTEVAFIEAAEEGGRDPKPGPASVVSFRAASGEERDRTHSWLLGEF